ncbi:acylphosphatase-2 [Diorhabda carinulata]|uniref:acylphosphatase-2 n=1 Tax=Diorhabda carinulata TaxID=1163345 RepID=UPI0025A0376C|nr:acylphosphatase-2 [Diorhabda carinulata]
MSVGIQNRAYLEQNMNFVDPLVSVEFEVFGKVQGVSLPKYCKDMCEQLGVSGWVKNTKKGTVQGKLQGVKSSIDQMIHWLTNAGSPGSQIEKCELSNWQNLARPDYKGFQIRF